MPPRVVVGMPCQFTWFGLEARPEASRATPARSRDVRSAIVGCRPATSARSSPAGSFAVLGFKGRSHAEQEPGDAEPPDQCLVQAEGRGEGYDHQCGVLPGDRRVPADDEPCGRHDVCDVSETTNGGCGHAVRTTMPATPTLKAVEASAAPQRLTASSWPGGRCPWPSQPAMSRPWRCSATSPRCACAQPDPADERRQARLRPALWQPVRPICQQSMQPGWIGRLISKQHEKLQLDS